MVRRTVELRITATTVEGFFRGRRVCSHLRDDRPGEQTIIAAHMPKAHRAYAEWTAERLVDGASQFGESTTGLVEVVLRSRAHRQQGLRSSLGILRLSKAYRADRLEGAAHRALALGTTSYASLESILKHGLDRQVLPAETTHGPPPAMAPPKRLGLAKQQLSPKTQPVEAHHLAGRCAPCHCSPPCVTFLDHLNNCAKTPYGKESKEMLTNEIEHDYISCRSLRNC